MAGPVITITGNLLLEWTFDFGPSNKSTRRAESESFQLGGKGVNVARMLQRLGQTTTALTFADERDILSAEAWIKKNGIDLKRFPLGAAARRGFVLRTRELSPHEGVGGSSNPGAATPSSPDTSPHEGGGGASNPGAGTPPSPDRSPHEGVGGSEEERTFLGLDKPVPLASWQAACHWIGEREPAALAFCGSFPGWSARHHRVALPLLDSLKTSGCPCFLDTYGPPLESLATLPWDWVHLNRGEWEALDPGNRETLAAQSGLLLSAGADELKVSRPGEEAIEIFPPKVENASPTGCGDVLFATFIRELLSGKSWRDALGPAVSCAAANAAHPGVADFPLPEEIAPPEQDYRDSEDHS